MTLPVGEVLAGALGSNERMALHWKGVECVGYRVPKRTIADILPYEPGDAQPARVGAEP